MSVDKKILQYVQWKSMVSPDFWHKLAEIKLDVEKLEESEKEIHCSFSNFEGRNCLMEIDCTAFNKEFKATSNCFPCSGSLFNKNTIESFKECDKAMILREQGQRLHDMIMDGSCLIDPSLLNRFVLLSFADLKKYNFYFWFAFPASIDIIVYESSTSQKITECFTKEDIDLFSRNYNSIEERNLLTFFTCDSQLNIKYLKDILKIDEINEIDVETTYFCFSDPSEYEQPGWPLRNFILLLIKLCPSIANKTIKVLSVRQYGNRLLDKSKIFYVDLTNVNCEIEKSNLKWTGWEKHKEKLIPKMAAMADSMDPIRLSEDFSNLNLKLMKWRLLPNLNLDIIKQQKCLLFGSGTLGCAIARNLLSWGVVNFSFIDCGNVSYSNPARQCLFTHKDATEHKLKALAAAERLKEILPSINSNGYTIQIPMPGHVVADSMKNKTIENIEKIKELVQSHDVLFLITDSRESRWLPTLLGAFYGKIVITTALGFDSYLVMRHGGRVSNESQHKEVKGLKCISGTQLGCYFCNDVTSPGNSMKDRTLDQQCTVTRPGVSNISSAIAVELMVSILQHNDKIAAPAYYQLSNKLEDVEIPEGILGIIPHSIRGYLSTFQHILPATEKFTQCIACSDVILNEFATNGNEFLLKVFNSNDYLGELSGISKIGDDLDEDFDCDEFDSE